MQVNWWDWTKRHWKSDAQVKYKNDCVLKLNICKLEWLLKDMHKFLCALFFLGCFVNGSFALCRSREGRYRNTMLLWRIVKVKRAMKTSKSLIFQLQVRANKNKQKKALKCNVFASRTLRRRNRLPPPPFRSNRFRNNWRHFCSICRRFYEAYLERLRSLFMRSVQASLVLRDAALERP